MVKFVKNKRFQWKKVLSAALAVLLLVGAIAGIAALASKDTKTISSFAFTRGSIDANGNHVKNDTSIYTEDMFECQGLIVDPDFTASGTYQVFYYAADETFIGATAVMSANDGTYVKEDDFAFAKYARVVITPDASVYANEGEEFKIRFYEVTGYASDYTITVNKKQKLSILSVFAEAENKANLYGEGRFETDSFQFVSDPGCGRYVYHPLGVGSFDYVVVKVAKNTFADDGLSVFDAANGESVSGKPIVLDFNSECAYVCYKISGLDAIYCTVDAWSVNALEIYLV